MKVDPHAADWVIVRDHCAKLLKGSRAELEAPGLDPARTEFLRGSIAAINAVLGLAKADPARD